MVINEFSNEQIDSMYSDAEFVIFINHYFSSFDLCVQQANVSQDYGAIKDSEWDIYLRIVLANLSKLEKDISELEKNLSYSYSEVQKNIVGNIQGRLRMNQYVRDKVTIRVPREYSCVIKWKSSVTPENVYLVFILDYVLNLLSELKKYLINKRGRNISELEQIEKYFKEFKQFTNKSYFVECKDELNVIKNQYKNTFPQDKWNLIANRIRKGKIRSCRNYIKVFDWYDNLRKGSLLFVDANTIELMRYAEGFANKLFELWCLYSIKQTFINEFNSELLEENDIMGSAKGYIYKLKVITGGTIEIYFQKGNELYWNSREDLVWKYKLEDNEQGLVGIPDISVRYVAMKESLIMIDIKNRIRDVGKNSEEIYKMIGYFTNFKKAFSEKYSSDVKKQAALLFRNDNHPFEENLESDEGYLMKVLSVSPSEDEKLNSKQFKILCEYVLNMQGFDGTTSDIMGGYIKEAKNILDSVVIDEETEDDVAYRIGENNHARFNTKFNHGELAKALQYSMESIKENYFPHIWNYMDEETKRILGMAECLYSSITPCDDADYAPFCLEYCRALEVQLNATIFNPFKVSIDTVSLANRNRYYEKMNQGRPLTLGECLFSFEKCNHQRFPMIELKSFVQREIKDSTQFLLNSVDAMRDINVNVRRKAAHTEVMTYDELVETRQRIMGIGNINLFYSLLDKR